MIPSDKYSFHVEPFEAVLPLIKDMLTANHDETGIFDRPFTPDFERYIDVERQGRLAFFTIRCADQVVGYASFFLDRHIYQRDILAATQSLNYVDKGHRGVGYSFMKFCDDKLREHGVNSIWRHTNRKMDISKIFERMGYTLVQKDYRKDFP